MPHFEILSAKQESSTQQKEEFVAKCKHDERKL